MPSDLPAFPSAGAAAAAGARSEGSGGENCGTVRTRALDLFALGREQPLRDSELLAALAGGRGAERRVDLGTEAREITLFCLPREKHVDLFEKADRRIHS